MNKINRFYSLLNNGIEFASGIGLVVFIIRFFTLTDSGNWFLFIAIFSLFSALRDALVQSALIKLTAGEALSNSYSAIKTALAVVLLVELIVGLGVVSTSLLIQSSLSKLLIFYSVYSIPSAILRLSIFYLRGQLQVREIVLLNAIQLGVLIIGLLTTAFYSPHLRSVIIALGAANAIGIFYVTLLLPVGEIMRSSISYQNLAIIWKYGKYAMTREAVSAASSRISLFFSGSLLNLSQTAILGVSQRFSQLALLPNNAIQSLLFPTIVKSVKQNDLTSVKHEIENSLANLLALTIPCATLTVICSEQLLRIVSGTSYQTGWGILSVYLLISTLITPFGTAFGSLVTALGKPAIAFKIVLMNTFINITLSFMLMKTIGLWGAPLAMAATEIIGFFVVIKISSNLANISLVAIVNKIAQIYVRNFHSLPTLFKGLKNKLNYAK
jgi:O-antigen/teichoic acid export membrane protein